MQLASSIATFFLLASSVNAFDVKSLSAEERSALSAKLDAWKASQHGQVSLNRNYHTEDMDLDDQLQRFGTSLEIVARLNAQEKHATFTVDNQFGLMTSEEFAEFVRASGLINPKNALESANVTSSSVGIASGTIDWTTSGCVAAPKNQASCGSCWAFSAVGTVESAFCLANARQLTLFSEQQVTSCAGQHGCSGGWPSAAMKYLANSGICTGADYPYISGQTTNTETCSDNNCAHTPLSISNVVDINTEDGIEKALSITPVSICLQAGNDAFKYYKSGVISSNCGTTVDHAVIAVGYGNDNLPYFKVKNSWGTGWGENGFFRIQRGVGGVGMCGLAQFSSYPVISSSQCGPVRSDTDYSGYDLSSSPGQPADCCSKCSSTSGCVAYSWYQGTCYLKSGVGSAVSKAGVISSVLKSSNQCQQAEQNTDYSSGNDIVTIQSSQGDCCALCLQNNDCNAYSWYVGYCSLKRGRSNVTQKSGVVSSRVYRCGALERGVDYAGNDISQVAGAAPEDCCAICRQTSGCGAFSWNNYNGGTCYLKSSKGATSSNSGVVSATL
ncbi:cysteine protease family C01A [Thraustotheca clavata]|uniref:Cysteine protease family C01A n=1 Tax=Thraustotheca clavata TaxID=74557 RepID=A0A0A7CMA3_9STRA|nr:secreted protein [Thraustotheca clavata]OQR95823.1 cysteine protease family C01A [Thraustotheca clavata]